VPAETQHLNFQKQDFNVKTSTLKPKSETPPMTMTILLLTLSLWGVPRQDEQREYAGPGA
jgi:hypothetical protein